MTDEAREQAFRRFCKRLHIDMVLCGWERSVHEAGYRAGYRDATDDALTAETTTIEQARAERTAEIVGQLWRWAHGQDKRPSFATGEDAFRWAADRLAAGYLAGADAP